MAAARRARRAPPRRRSDPSSSLPRVRPWCGARRAGLRPAIPGPGTTTRTAGSQVEHSTEWQEAVRVSRHRREGERGRRHGGRQEREYSRLDGADVDDVSRSTLRQSSRRSRTATASRPRCTRATHPSFIRSAWPRRRRSRPRTRCRRFPTSVPRPAKRASSTTRPVSVRNLARSSRRFGWTSHTSA